MILLPRLVRLAVIFGALVIPLASTARALTPPVDFDFNRDAGGGRAYLRHAQPEEPLTADDTAAWSPHGGRDGGGALKMTLKDPTAFVVHQWEIPVEHPGRALTFSVWVRGALSAGIGEGPEAGLGLRALDRAEGGGSRQKTMKTTAGWQRFACTWTPARHTHTVVAILALTSPGRVWFDDASVRVEDYGGSEDEPGLFRVEGALEVVAGPPLDAPVILRPLPLAHAGQVPLTFALHTKPVDALASVAVETIGGNPVARIALKPLPAGTRVEIRWHSLVLAGPARPTDPPAVAPKPREWPAEARPWLQPTWTVNSADPALVREAESLTKDTDDVREIIRRAIKRAGEIQNNRKPASDADRAVHAGDILTASAALTLSGSCTSNANLFAALLRASGVPARFVAGYPNWSGPLQTHALVEVWVPGWGWYPVESTWLRENWPPFGQIQVSVVPPEHETHELSRRRWVIAGGVPYLSLTESNSIRDDMRANGLLGDHCDHHAYYLKNFSPDVEPATWQAALAAGQARWSRWLERRAARGADASLLATPWEEAAVLTAASDDSLHALLGLLAEPEK
jgi:Transglutaminase-like superfamily